MKLLENVLFEAINSKLTNFTGDYSIDARIESYSCKMTTSDKKLFRQVSQDTGNQPHDLQALSPPQTLSPSRQFSSSGSEDGDGYLCDTICTKTLLHLIGTLNASFPDYDFSSAKSCEFSKEPSVGFVRSAIDNQLTALGGDVTAVRQQLWTALDEEIRLAECQVYRNDAPDSGVGDELLYYDSD